MTHIRPTVLKVFEKSYGRGAGGESAVAYSFSVDINALSTGSFALPTITSGNEFIYQFASLSCNDDTAIHRLALTKNLVVFFYADFLIGGVYDFPGETAVFGDIVYVSISNRSVEQLTFNGVVNTTIRKI